ncbi:MAG: hypothetical protein K2G53_04255 [Muribaculaceae bacterium]|nr:hypothetical protein [Muribaculaceae bacterium]
MKFRYIYKFVIAAILALSCSPQANAGASAADVMTKAANQIKSAKGILCKFTLAADGGKVSGTLKSTGTKFALLTNAYSTWYNGKDMWTYNASSKETTLVKPTIAELREVNPLEYIKGYSTDYTPTFSKKKLNGKYVINLTPKKKSNEVKSMELILNAGSFKPEKLSLNLKSGVNTTVTINSINYNSPNKVSDFEYPKSQYPKVKVIDLR